MNVVGIDPAPAKGLAVFDGESFFVCGANPSGHANACDARRYVNDLSERQDNVLVCWDAPLTGPPDELLHCESSKSSGNVRPTTVNVLSQRIIDSFFNSEKGLKAPAGISVLPYSQCSHWTISRCLTGYPRVGPYDRVDNLPFQLVRFDDRPFSGKWIVETHPAVAMWLWAKDASLPSLGFESEADFSWRYKGAGTQSYPTEHRKKVRQALWKYLATRPFVQAILDEHPGCVPSREAYISDDQLDSIVSYLVGRLWLENRGYVQLIGDRDRGAMLLPVTDGEGNRLRFPDATGVAGNKSLPERFDEFSGNAGS